MSKVRIGGRKPPEEETDIDLTPMLDVVFIMLIFFIVTASFVKEQGLEMNKQDDQPPDKVNPNRPILIRIGESGKIWVRETLVDLRAVRANVERLHAENPKSSVVIQADDKAKTDWLIQVMDQSREAGVWNVTIAAVE